MYPTGGHGRAPSVSGDLFISRDAARTAAIQMLIDQLPKSLFDHEKALHVKMEKVRHSLQGLLAQPTLF